MLKLVLDVSIFMHQKTSADIFDTFFVASERLNKVVL